MSQFISHSEWEHIFTEEALTVEELLSSGGFLLLEQSKIRIALDNKILGWDKFKVWITEKMQCACVKSQLSPVEIQVLKNKFKENKKTFAHHNIWTNDIIPLEIWDNSLIVLGLYPSENLMTIPNSIFVLCPPQILKQITESEFSENFEIENSPLAEPSESIGVLDFDESISIPTHLDFSKLNPNTSNSESTKTAYSIWNLIDANHNNSSELVRKQFDAYVVLKIVDQETRIYKMDEDMIKEEINPSVFSYSLLTENLFSKIYKSGLTESFAMDSLELSILDFKFVCVSPLKIGNQTLGFLVGFKLEKTTQQDESALELISNQNVA